MRLFSRQIWLLVFVPVESVEVGNLIREEKMGYGVVLKSGTVRRIDPSTGFDKGAVGNSNAVGAASDGDTIVIVYANGAARRYDANTGHDIGSVGISNVKGCSILSGVVILNYADGRSRRYDAKTGYDKGSV